MKMEADEFSDSMEFIKMETEPEPEEQPTVTHLCHREIIKRIEDGEFSLRDHNKRSRVWTVFAKIHDQNDEEVNGFVYCRQCGRILTFNNSTSNLVKHKCYYLKYVSKIDTPRTENSDSPATNNVQALPIDDITVAGAKNVLTGLFTKCFLKSRRSYEVLQDDNFKAIFQELIAFGAKFGTNVDTEKIIPDSLAVANNINEIYKNCLARVFKEIAAAKENGFSLACHLWSNDFSKKRCFVLTMHFFKSGKFTNRLLDLLEMEDDKCSNENIAEHINNILKEHNCQLSNTSLIVASGCSNISEGQTVPCISTLLSDALVKSMNATYEISQLMTSCLKLRRLLVGKEMGIKLEKHTSFNHWLAIYKVLELTLNAWTDIKKAFKPKGEPQMANINRQHLEAVIKTLRPFKDAIEGLEAGDSATLHLVLVYLHNLRKFCEAENSERKEYNFIEDFKQLLRQHLDRIAAEHLTIFHKVALFLYPPANKLLLFDQKEKKKIEDECEPLMHHLKGDFKTSRKPEEPEDSDGAAHTKRLKLFSDFVYSDTDKDTSELIAEELQIYKLTRAIDSEDFDVFSWWEQQQPHFPRLYKLSQMVLSTPATSAAAQRIFASSGDLLCDNSPEFGTNNSDIKNIAFVRFNANSDELDLKD